MSRRVSAMLVLILLFACISPRPASTAPITLTDIAGHWAEAEITQAVDQGWVTGYPDGTFHPDAPVTRAAYVKMLLAALGLQPAPGEGLGYYADTDGHWLQTSGWLVAGQRAWLFDQQQYPDRRFAPDSPIPRDEAAMMAAHALGRRVETEIRGNLVPPGGYRGEVEVARLYGVLRGDVNSALRLEETTTRAQAVVMIQWVLQARERAAVPVTAGSWQPVAPWESDCLGYFLPTLLVNIAPSRPFDGTLTAYARNCSTTETYRLSAPDLRLVINPYGGHAPEPIPLFAVQMPALDASLPPRTATTMTVAIAPGLAPGWYTATLVSDQATASDSEGNRSFLEIPYTSTRFYAGATFLVTTAALPAGEATVSPVYPATVAGLPVPTVTARWGDGKVRYEVNGLLSCQNGTGKETELNNWWTGAVGSGFATRFPFDNALGRLIDEVEGIPGEAEIITIRAQFLVRTCLPDRYPGDLLGMEEVLWKVPLTR